MRYIRCPDDYQGVTAGHDVFLAGGITGCTDWQAEAVRLLGDTDLTLVSPRRKNFPIHDPGAAEAQIVWEHKNLRRCEAVLFWFPAESVCPIALYELGAWLCRPKTIFLGAHPDYVRRSDIIIQSRLERPALRIVWKLRDLADQVREWGLEKW